MCIFYRPTTEIYTQITFASYCLTHVLPTVIHSILSPQSFDLMGELKGNLVVRGVCFCSI